MGFLGQNNKLTSTKQLQKKSYKTSIHQLNDQTKKKSSKALIYSRRFALICMGIVVVLTIAMALIPAKERPLIEGSDVGLNDIIIEALSVCGVADSVEEVENVEHDESLDNMNIDGEKGYRISANGINNIILYMVDGTVNMVRYADNTLYENGAPVDNISNYVLTDYEESRYLTQAENAVESILKSPSSAKFSNILESNIWIEDGVVNVQGYVDAQNSYGAEMRGDYQVQFENGTITSLIFDGTEYLQ